MIPCSITAVLLWLKHELQSKIFLVTICFNKKPPLIMTSNVNFVTYVNFTTTFGQITYFVTIFITYTDI